MDCWWEAGCDAVNATVEFVEDDVIPVAREGVEVAGELATGAGENIQQTMALAAGEKTRWSQFGTTRPWVVKLTVASPREKRQQR